MGRRSFFRRVVCAQYGVERFKIIAFNVEIPVFRRPCDRYAAQGIVERKGHVAGAGRIGDLAGTL